MVQSNDFAQSMESDLENVFFNTSEFTEVVNYKHKLTPSISDIYYGIFNDPYKGMKAGNNTVNTIKPFVKVIEHLLKHKLTKLDVLTIKGVQYGIQHFEPDGVGVIVIFLKAK